ncbi:SCO-spondin [Durusdinium trenchii]|uniref:SCO-spondin n=1 Tax=Durusdinium trenchii TaxID=1381693 RepID=A0ABP0JLM4_9DINO
MSTKQCYQLFDLRLVPTAKPALCKLNFWKAEVYEEASQVSYQFDAELDNTKVTMGTLDNLGMLGRDYSFWSFWDTSSLVTNNKYPLLGEQSGLNLYVTKTGTDTVELEHGLDGSSCQSTISIQTDGTWNHVAVVYSASAQTSEFYVNGQLEDSTCSAFSPSDGTVEYGGGGGQGQWAGSLQQARLYTEAIGTEHLLNYTNWCLSYSCSAGYRDSNEWEDAGSNCTDQFDDALPVNRTGTVDRTTVGSYTLTYDCMQNSEDVILATLTRTVEVVESMYINPDLYWIVQREAGVWSDAVSQCYDTADTFNAEIADMHQYFNWSADTRLFLGTSGGSTEVNYTVSYHCSLTDEVINKTLMVRDAIRLYGPDPHVVRAGRLRWNQGQCEICDTSTTDLDESACSYSHDNSTTADKCGLSSTGWKASASDGAGAYVELDLGSDLQVTGVITKGHSIEEAWIKTFTVSYKTNTSSDWVELSTTFPGNEDQSSEVENMLDAVVEARYWRITAQTFENVVAARVAMMVCQSTSSFAAKQGAWLKQAQNLSFGSLVLVRMETGMP